MTGWLIFGLIVMLILFLMLIRLRLVIEADDRFFLQLKVLWMMFRVIPSNKKEKKIKLRDYEIKRVRKREEKAKNKRRKVARKAAENKKKNQNGASEESGNTEKSDIIGMIKLVWVLLKDVKSAVIGCIGIDLEKMYIVVSSDDAANTALLYGAVTQGANLLFEFLRNTTGFRMTGAPKDIAVIPDFGFGSITLKLKLILHIRIWQIFALAFQVLFSFLKYQMKNKSNQIINKTVEEEQHG